MADDNDLNTGNAETKESEEFDFLGNVKILLKIEDDTQDKILLTCVSMTKQSVLNYCNIRELPSALNYVVCQISADSYKEAVSKADVGKITGNVASVSEDGRSVSFTNGSELYTSVENRISRTAELRRYRKLYRI